jgi:hypothetical protein
MNGASSNGNENSLVSSLVDGIPVGMATAVEKMAGTPSPAIQSRQLELSVNKMRTPISRKKFS